MIRLKTQKDIELLRTAGGMLAEMLFTLGHMVEPGVQVLDIEKKAEQLLRSKNVQPAFKGFMGYPSVICVSLNNEVVHAVPRNRMVQEGDLVSLDFGLVYEQRYVDAAVTVGAGHLSPEAKKLIDVCKRALTRGIKVAKAGRHIGDIGFAVQTYVENQGCSVVYDLVGHGVGFKLHEDPAVPNYGEPRTGKKIESGLVIAIEPMITQYSSEVVFTPGEWAVVTKDHGLSTHFEHTIAITDQGTEILTEYHS